MTIALNIKVNDGVVLAADSASTLQVAGSPTTVVGPVPGFSGPQILNVYNNANKIFNLVKGLPIGALVWGAGAVGTQSIESLMKDLRKELTDGKRDFRRDSYTLEGIARVVRTFFWEERYSKIPVRGDLGIIVAGYPAGAEHDLAEEYRITMNQIGCDVPQLLRPKESAGMSWSGMGEPIARLVTGVSQSIGEALRVGLGVPESQNAAAQQILRQHLAAPLVFPPMPIQDVIELADFLVNLTIGYYRFCPGAPMVGGPVEIAAITKHEGFKWVRRKLYFSEALNPPPPIVRETPDEDRE